MLGTGGAERARITPAGKFGIGTNAPAHQLEVVGPASVTVGVSAGGSGFAEIELVGQAGKNYITSDDTLSFDIGGTERATVATTGLNVTSGTLSQGGTAVSLSGHTHSGVYDPAGTAASEVSTHAAAADPHPTYLTSAEGNAAYEAINSVSTHNAATTSVHGITNTANLLTTSTSFANISTPAGSATTITSTTAGSPTDITGLTYTFTPTYNEDVFVQQNLVVTQSASPASAVNIIGKILVNGTAATPFSYFGLAASHGSPNGWTQGMSHTFVATSGVSYTVKCAAYKSSANGTYSASNGSTMSVIRVRA